MEEKQTVETAVIYDAAVYPVHIEVIYKDYGADSVIIASIGKTKLSFEAIGLNTMSIIHSGEHLPELLINKITLAVMEALEYK